MPGFPSLTDEGTEAGRRMSPAYGCTPGGLILEPLLMPKTMCPSRLGAAEFSELCSWTARVPILPLARVGGMTLDKLLTIQCLGFPLC